MKHLLTQRTEKRRNLLDSIQPGQVRKGVVKNITDFGAFIDLDGMDGLLHITDMSWGRVNHPSEIVRIGDEIEEPFGQDPNDLPLSFLSRMVEMSWACAAPSRVNEKIAALSGVVPCT